LSKIILTKVELSQRIFEKQTSNFMKIRPVEAEFCHADGVTDKQTWRR